MFHFKNISTLLLLFAVSFAVFSGNILQLQQLYIKWNMEKMLGQEQLVTIENLQPSQFKWRVSGYEMQVEGSLFDVKELTVNNDGTITVKGLFDEKEHSILDKLQCKEEEEDNATTQNILSQVFNGVLALPKQPWLLKMPVSSECQKQYALTSARLCCLALEILSPPPKA